VCWPAANIYGQETAALADAMTAQNLVNLCSLPAGHAGRLNASVVIINLAPTGPLVHAPADKPALVSNRPAMTAV
jgi:hypothetical protein